mmetsp:Transcript_34249/g.110616  ORF Transcript_34249/g.110616 Transcript_34249/m.110616 type:complete len:286 (+) Transcript_34249:211-1068(+)
MVCGQGFRSVRGDRGRRFGVAQAEGLSAYLRRVPRVRVRQHEDPPVCKRRDLHCVPGVDAARHLHRRMVVPRTRTPQRALVGMPRSLALQCSRVHVLRLPVRGARLYLGRRLVRHLLLRPAVHQVCRRRHCGGLQLGACLLHQLVGLDPRGRHHSRHRAAHAHDCALDTLQSRRARSLVRAGGGHVVLCFPVPRLRLRHLLHHHRQCLQGADCLHQRPDLGQARQQGGARLPGHQPSGGRTVRAGAEETGHRSDAKRLLSTCRLHQLELVAPLVPQGVPALCLGS